MLGCNQAILLHAGEMVGTILGQNLMLRKDAGFIALILALFVIGYLLRAISRDAIILLLVLVPSVIVHEVSHGYVALKFGDDTARRAGRLTLNPLAHIDPIGSVLLPALLIFVGLTPIGYAKPVPVNVSNLRSPRNQSVMVSLAGPFVNLAGSMIAGAILHYLLLSQSTPQNIATGVGQVAGLPFWDGVIFYVGVINLLLGIFNLIPIPPLDGSAVIERLLPSGALPGYFRLRMLMLPIVIIMFLFFPGFLGSVLSPVINVWIKIFVPA